MNPRANMPRFGQIEAALRRTTERLASEFSSPQELAPSWTPFEWQIARAVASLQGITMLLSRQLRWQGPPAWQEFIATQCHLSRQRDTHIAATLMRVDDALRRAGVACVALKGSALRKLHLTGRGYEIETEMLIKLARRGARIARVPITLRYQGAPSKLRPLRDTTRTCFLAVRYRFFPERFQ